MTYIKQEAEEAERTLRERIQKIEANRLSLEEEVSRLKSTNLADKLSAEEQLQISKQQVKIEEVYIFHVIFVEKPVAMYSHPNIIMTTTFILIYDLSIPTLKLE